MYSNYVLDILEPKAKHKIENVWYDKNPKHARQLLTPLNVPI